MLYLAVLAEMSEKIMENNCLASTDYCCTYAFFRTAYKGSDPRAASAEPGRAEIFENVIGRAGPSRKK